MFSRGNSVGYRQILFQLVAKNCYSHFGRSNTAKVGGEGGGAAKNSSSKQQQEHKQQEKQQQAAESVAKQHKQQPRNSEGCPAEGSPRRVPEGWCPEGWRFEGCRPKPGKSGAPNLEGWGPRRVWAPKGGKSKFRAFFPSPATIFIISPSFGGRFVEFWWCD